MAHTIFAKLPSWSKSIDPKLAVDYSDLVPIAVAFLALPVNQRREIIKQYSEQYCFPRFDLERGSAIYLFFRVVFRLPKEESRSKVKVFGGWLHPSVGTEQPDFDLSWPVHIDELQRNMTIYRFTGYFGKGYDAIGEYDYFMSQYPIAKIAEIETLVIR